MKKSRRIILRSAAKHLINSIILAEFAALVVAQTPNDTPALKNIVVRDGVVITPPVTDAILEGITRKALIALCRSELGLEVVERSLDRSELYAAEEIFLAGTAVGVGPVIEVDRRPIGTGKVGPIGGALQTLYDRVARGSEPGYLHWLTPAFELGAEKLQTKAVAAS